MPSSRPADRQLYDDIGTQYASFRRPDPRIAAAIDGALGECDSIVNVGAGSGSYEPRNRRVVAVEPSTTMIRQRPPGTAPAIRAVASALPFADDAFSTSLAILTLHHWPDRRRGLAELARVARDRVVLLTWLPVIPEFWLYGYFPELLAIDLEIFPTVEEYEEVLGPIEVHPVPIPHDCIDGFLCAYWQRPERYLDDAARSAISTFNRIDAGAGLQRLRDDLETGKWEEAHGSLRHETARDFGYRLVVTRKGPRS